MRRRILLTSALPYANGDIHLGHLVEYIQADIWARFQKLRGHECYFVCADDAHGTPIMLRAEKEKILPEKLIDRMKKNHQRDFAALGVDFDNYHSTHSEENRNLSEKIFTVLKENDCIVEKKIQQLYDKQKQMFLPDRYVRGDCPNCGAPNQYGDSCEVCGNVHTTADLKKPVSVLSETTPVMRESLHYFLQLTGKEESLINWKNEKPLSFTPNIRTPRLQREAANKLNEWLKDGLRDWDISRDPPYFGFRIPSIDEEKYFYVWLDAPIGYMASFLNLCEKKKLPFEDFWLERKNKKNDGSSDETELYHFIGKDILYFHGLFWPTVLKNSGYRQPTRLFVHGFLTVNGEKMSKSRGTFITAETYIKSGLPPDALRYYYACKLADRIEDIDLNLDDFVLRVNGDLVGKLINIPSRVAGFIHRFFKGKLNNAKWHPRPQHDQFAMDIATAYEERKYQEVVRLLRGYADTINAAIDDAKPWILAKDETQHAELHKVCSRTLREFDLLIGYLSPVMPALAKKVATFLGRSPYRWKEHGIAPLESGHEIKEFSHLMQRLDEKAVNALIKPEADAIPSATTPTPPVSIGDFSKLDVRIAVVMAAEEVTGADKLLKLQLDVGDGMQRQVFAGIKQHYAAEALVGQQVVYLANLQPRKMRFGVSEGMVLAASNDNTVILLKPAGEAAAGMKVK